ncbi:MAG: hypothetical protein IK108_06035 [Clostridia bacterium]|nr:hypothetical protein [Clostridia bacterium]
MAETFKLPASSYEEVLKLIQAYASVKEGVALSLDQINQSTGVPRTVVSKNNGFLVQIGLITEGNKKAATDIGRALGRAYASKIDYEVERIWKEIISNNDFLSRMISAVRIRNGMDRTNYINHIIYSSGLKDSKVSRTGAGAVIEILKSVNVLNEVDGKMTVKDSIENNQSGAMENTSDDTSTAVADNHNVASISLPAGTHSVTINININCAVSEMDELAEKLKALLENLSQ